MREAAGPEVVVITSSIYEKAKPVFGEYASQIRWEVCPDAEAEVARVVAASGARITALGAAGYRGGAIYPALQASARGAGALVARFGVGYDGIDLVQCCERGIRVTITPGMLNQSVAEHTMALLLALVRNIPALERRLRGGSFVHQTGVELSGRTLGVAGFGGIGRVVARIASAGFGMRVLAFDAVPIAAQFGRDGRTEGEDLAAYGLAEYSTDFTAIAPRVDVLSIHLPVLQETRGFFDARRLGLLRPGALLVNTSRGALVDERALFDALASGALGGAALDVFSSEPYAPVDPQHDLRTLANTVLTPHVASDTVEANERMARRVVRNIQAFREGRVNDLDLVPQLRGPAA
jgi:D-3-phosphoglycerate dehydrogenase / 2-oxoglutarate reductase